MLRIAIQFANFNKEYLKNRLFSCSCSQLGHHLVRRNVAWTHESRLVKKYGLIGFVQVKINSRSSEIVMFSLR